MSKKEFLLASLLVCSATTYAMELTTSLINLNEGIEKTIFSYAIGDWQVNKKKFHQAAKVCTALQLTCKKFAPINKITQSMSINNSNKNILLMYAAQAGIPCLLQHAIAQKAILDCIEKPLGYTPLSSAIRNSNYKCCALLLKAGANINRRETYYEGMLYHNYYKPIHLVARTGNIKIAELLIAHKANINARDKYGKTAFALAYENQNNQNMINLLINHGAEIPEWYKKQQSSAANR